jgi:PAS domain S-box-containing protein
MTEADTSDQREESRGRDEHKSRQMLLDDLAALRQRIADLEFVENELVVVADKLRESQESYRVLVEEINDIIYTVNRAKVVTYISPVIEPVSGYAPSEILGRSFLDFVFEEDVSRVDGQFQENISGRKDLVQFRFRVLTKAGDIRWARTYSRPIFLENRVVGLRGVMTDMTQWVELEDAQERLIGDLHGALDQVATLRGLLPICSSCKKIRDEHGRWVQLEAYIQQHSEARFTHDLCPDCARELYPGVYQH